MSALQRQTYANPDDALFVKTSGNSIIQGNITADYITANSAFELLDNSVPRQNCLTIAAATNGANASPILQTNGQIRFGQFSQANANSFIQPSAPGVNTDTLQVGGNIVTNGGAGTQGLRLNNAQYISFLDNSNPDIEGMRMVTSTTGTPGLTFSDIAVQPGSTLYFSQIGSNANSLFTPSQGGQNLDLFKVRGTIEGSYLGLKASGGDPSIGTALLTNGVAIVSTTTADVNSIILLTRYGVGTSTALGELRVSNKGANNFTITSSDPANPTSTETGDESEVMWMIVSQSTA